ncbi:MAG: hypothetical protein MJA83_02725 [Gammaproteobacteria bacterium]|nr:hypothetical protein [Gammaproteobacteria bacterium]
MSWDSLQSQWQRQNGNGSGPEQTAEIISAARIRNKELHQRVRRRDRLETIVSALLAPFFAVAAFIEGRDGQWITMAGLLILVAACTYIPFKLHKARRLLPTVNNGNNLVSYLREEYKALAAQAELLRGILSWYLAPMGVGILVVFIGGRGLTLDGLYYVAGTVVIYALIYYANIVAANESFAPKLQEIENELESLGESL